MASGIPDAETVMNAESVGFLTVVYDLLGAALAVSYLAGFIYAILALRHPAPGVRILSEKTWWNPANALLEPEMFSERGTYYRKRCVRAFITAGICFCLFCFITMLSASQS